MNTIYSNFLNFQPKLSRTSERKRIAEYLSPYSDNSKILFELNGNILGAKESLALIFISLHCSYWQTDKIIGRIAQKCYQHEYNGKWRIVQEVLEKATDPETFIAIYLQHFSPNTLFGNFSKDIVKYSLYYSLRPTERIQKVKKPQRKRGYDDKGTLRPFHQKGRVFGKEEKEREDRRSMIAHPLRNNSNGIGELSLNTSQRREELDHD